MKAESFLIYLVFINKVKLNFFRPVSLGAVHKLQNEGEGGGGMLRCVTEFLGEGYYVTN